MERWHFMASQHFILLCNVVWVPISAVVLFQVGCNLADFRATELLGSPNHESWLSAILFAYILPRCIMIYFLFLALATLLLKSMPVRSNTRLYQDQVGSVSGIWLLFFVSLWVTYIHKKQSNSSMFGVLVLCWNRVGCSLQVRGESLPKA